MSTESKIKQFVDEYLINYPQENVRKSTEKLLASLFRKGIPDYLLRYIEPTPEYHLSTYRKSENFEFYGQIKQGVSFTYHQHL